MYLLPQKYTCDRCGHEENYSPHSHNVALHIDGEPVCNKCLGELIRASCGILRFGGYAYAGGTPVGAI